MALERSSLGVDDMRPHQNCAGAPPLRSRVRWPHACAPRTRPATALVCDGRGVAERNQRTVTLAANDLRRGLTIVNTESGNVHRTGGGYPTRSCSAETIRQAGSALLICMSYPQAVLLLTDTTL